MKQSLNLYRITYKRKYTSNHIVRYVKAESQIEAVTATMPRHGNGEFEKVDSIDIKCLCKVDDIVNHTSAQGK